MTPATEAAPAVIVPPRIVPAEVGPAVTVPPRSVPAETATAKAASAKAVPAKKAAPPKPSAAKLSWREKRERRRRRRVWFEEILGWILVPVILYGCYWVFEQGLMIMGMTPETLMDGLHTILAHF